MDPSIVAQWITAGGIVVGAVGVLFAMHSTLERLERASDQNINAHRQIGVQLGEINVKMARLVTKTEEGDRRLERLEKAVDDISNNRAMTT